jgi:hexosaminidase
MIASLAASLAFMPLSTLPLVPYPAEIKATPGTFRINPQTTLTPESSTFAAQHLRASLSPATGFKFNLSSKKVNAIALLLKPNPKANPESYSFVATPTNLTITAPSEAGLFYGVQTLRQLLPVSIHSTTPLTQNWQIPCLTITDEPRFKWRGIMLDVARHFTTKAEVLKFIDTLALFKINTFHFHLTDDQGWRVEIKKYPRLTQVGSVRPKTVIGRNTAEYDNIPHGGFYTQDDLREIVAYAAERHITVVPEIDMPGHMVAAIAAYPELGDGMPAEVMMRWGVSDRVLNTKPETVQFCRDVLTEVMDIFPSEFIHIGGDECPKTQWEKDPAEQQRIKERGLKDEHELQSWFIQQMEDHLHQNGRRLIGWDEILEGGLPKRSAVMSWRGTGGGVTAANLGQDVVMTPTSHMYLDYYQSRSPEEPLAIGGYLPLQQVYSFNPIVPEIKTENHPRVLGVQGNIWTEYMKTFAHREYMAFPRALAVAEVGWTPQTLRNYDNFLVRLAPNLEVLTKRSVNFRTLEVSDTPAGSWNPTMLQAEWSTIRFDLSTQIKQSGNYRITFAYTSGAHRLDIKRAEIWINNKLAKFDEHEGTTGGSNSKNTYAFDGLVVKPGDKVELRATVRPDGGTDSNGHIYIDRT